MSGSDRDLQNKVVRLSDHRGGGTDSGGGGEPPHLADLRRRVEKLEAAGQTVAVTLTRIEERLSHLTTKEDLANAAGALSDKIAGVAGKLEAKASATELAEVKGRVSRLPSTGVVAALLGAAVAVLTILTRLHVLGGPGAHS